MKMLSTRARRRARIPALVLIMLLAIAAVTTGLPARSARPAAQPWSITCDGKATCTASGFDRTAQGTSVTWWQAPVGGAAKSYPATVGAELTVALSRTTAKRGQCTLWWVADAKGASRKYAVRNWKVIGSRCP